MIERPPRATKGPETLKRLQGSGLKSFFVLLFLTGEFLCWGHSVLGIMHNFGVWVELAGKLHPAMLDIPLLPFYQSFFL